MPVPPDQQHRSTFLLLLSYLPCLTSLPRSSSRTFLQPLFPPPSPPNARPFIHTTTSSFLRLSCRKRQFLPDIVLLDSQMPGKDGFEVLPKNTKKNCYGLRISAVHTIPGVVCCVAKYHYRGERFFNYYFSWTICTLQTFSSVLTK